MIRRVGEIYAGLFPGNPYEYFFLDGYYEQQYREDARFGRVVAVFSGLAAFVAGLGLFGMSSYMALRRRREIGIRKVLGASVFGIFRLFGRDFAVLLALSLLPAWPLTILGIRRWLSSFADRMGFDAGLFLAPLGVIALITALTLSLNIVRAARADPIESIARE